MGAQSVIYITLNSKHYTLIIYEYPKLYKRNKPPVTGCTATECGTHLCYELSTSQFSDMKVRRLTRQYGFFGYSIYRYLVNETLHNGSYLLLWCEETAQYWNASLEDVTRIVNGCIQVGLFNDELFRKHWGLTSADIQRTIWTMSGPVACSPGILVSPRSPNFRPADVLSTLNIKLMPKTTKKVFTYFRFETDHFYDTKVKRLKNKFGMEDWGVFHFIVNEIYRVEGCYNCNLQIFLCLFLEKLNMPLNTPVTKALQVRFSFLL